VSTTDYHAGGEPFRIVADPPVAIDGATVAERRMHAIDSAEVDDLRKLLCFEPRGHADMYGGFITPPDDDGADFGVLFWHKDGFSTACGHGTIALGVWALQTGRMAPDGSGTTDVVVDVPSGRVLARVHSTGDQITAVDFINVASYALHQGVSVATSRGEVVADVGFGGAIYAHLPAEAVGLAVTRDHYADLIAIGREVKWALQDTDVAHHPLDDRLSGIYGTILYDHLGVDGEGRLHQRNVTVFADGEVDRSPCGSGTCSRIAVLAAKGQLEAGQTLVHDSIVGTQFAARIVEHVTVADRPAVIPQVTGTAYRTGEHRFELDPADGLGTGFVLR
jgi:proline racemase/trans-L-3-hydroxyproline dehydratase